MAYFPRIFPAVAWVLLIGGSFVVPLSAQYGGPSILSRGGNSPGRRGRAPVSFTFYASARALYESGLIAPVVDLNGRITSSDLYGGSVEAGVYGGHDWRRSSLGLDYRGDYRRHSQEGPFNGFNQAIALEYIIRTSRRTQLSFRETGGTVNRAFGGFAAPAFADQNRIGVPLNEVFDVRTYFSQTSAFFAWQKSARVTLGGGADGFFIKRDARSLVNSQGYRAVGVASYRINRRDTIGIQYEYMHFDFKRAFADSTANSVLLRFDRRVSQNLLLAAALGAYRVRTSGTEVIELSPEVAAILGRDTGIAAFRRSVIQPSFDASVNYLQDRGRFYLSGSKTVGSGNGVYLTTGRTTINGGYSYTGVRRLSVGLSTGWTKTDSLGLDLGPLDSYQVGGGFSYFLGERMSLTGQIDYRTFNSSSTVGRNGMSASIGLSWSSSSLPLSIW